MRCAGLLDGAAYCHGASCLRLVPPPHLEPHRCGVRSTLHTSRPNFSQLSDPLPFLLPVGEALESAPFA